MGVNLNLDINYTIYNLPYEQNDYDDDGNVFYNVFL